MKPVESCLFDSSVWIVGQNHPQWFADVVEGLPDVATCLVAVGEYAVGMHGARIKRTRQQVRDFLERRVQQVAWFSHLPDDFATASRLIGEAIFASKAKPSFPDGLIAACALRTGRVVWTTDTAHFEALGCRAYNPLTDPDLSPPVQTASR